MAVRLTESRIPGGFERAKILGQVNSEYPGSQPYVLISYLASPLRIGPGKNFIINKYIVFAEDDDGADLDVTFTWTIQLEKKSSTETVPIDTNLGWYNFEYIEIFSAVSGDLTSELEPDLQKIIVRVELSNGVVLKLEQEVTILVSNIEKLINNDQNELVNHTNVGNRDITRLIANDYGQYLKKSKLSGSFDVPINFAAALLYLNSQKLNRSQFIESHVLENKLNNGGITTLTDQAELEPVGICALKTHLLAMLPISFTATSGSELVDPGTRSELESYYLGGNNNEYDYYNLYASRLSNETKIELYNSLRFPQSNIYYSNLFLHHYKSLNNIWRAIPKFDLSSEEEAVISLISQLKHGPINIPIEKTDLAARSFNISHSQYIQEILNTEFIPYQVIKIKVLDIRSGKPLKNARVKKIVINSSTVSSDPASLGHVLVENFDYETNYNDTDSLVLKSQKALDDFGYNTNGPANAYGPAGRMQYKNYWDDRIIDGSVKSVTAGDPPDDMLGLIVEEYESHRETDSNGILNIRIPHILLQGRAVSIEIGFWEFPIILEDISTTAGTRTTREFISRENKNELDTGFKIFWLGDQNLGWDENILLSGHFGWGVEDSNKQGLLRTAVKFTIKNNYEDFNELDEFLFSKFYDINNYNYNFVVFGMQWCQPVWDIFTDPVIPNIQDKKHIYINDNIYCNDDNYELLTISGYTDNAKHTSNNKNMHVVSNVNMATLEPMRQKGYGVYDVRANPARGIGDSHMGYDIYNYQNAPVFAIHGGKAIPRAQPPGQGFGNYVKLQWAAETIDLAHLREINPRPDKINNAGVRGVEVMAGEIIGYAGRSGNMGDMNPQHTHFRYRHGGDQQTLNSPIGQNDPNKFIIPHVNLPLVFPCRCNYISRDPSNCEFSTGVLVRGNMEAIEKCFAPIELCCPYMKNVARTSNKAPQKLQAQLKYIFIKNLNANYVNPGPVNGDIGILPTEPNTNPQNISVYPTRFAIRKFREVNFYSDQFLNAYVLEGGALDVLNNLITPSDAFQYLTDNGLFNENPFPIGDPNKCIQAQLKYISRTNLNANYRDPGAIDGDLGILPTEPNTNPQMISISRSRSAIRAFREVNGLSNAFSVDYIIPFTATSDEWNELDLIAPISNF